MTNYPIKTKKQAKLILNSRWQARLYSSYNICFSYEQDYFEKCTLCGYNDPD